MNKLILSNKKAKHEYDFIETFEAGIKLEGWMVKSIRAGKISASDGSYVMFRQGEAFIDGLHITKLSEASATTNPSVRAQSGQTSLKLLMKKKEILVLQEKAKMKGYTVVMTSLEWKGSLIKAQLALAKGKQLHDKRQTEKDRSMKKDAERAMKNARV